MLILKLVQMWFLLKLPQSLEDIKAIASSFENIPLFANMIEGGKTPILSRGELQKLGFKIAVYPLSGLFAATKAMKNCFEQLKEKRNYHWVQRTSFFSGI